MPFSPNVPMIFVNAVPQYLPPPTHISTQHYQDTNVEQAPGDKSNVPSESFELYTGKNREKILCFLFYFSRNFPIFFLKMGELFANFEKKNGKFGETYKIFP